MSDYIYFEGIAVYIFILLIATILILGVIGFVSALKKDEILEEMREQFYEERERSIELNRENMRLKLKCGELKVGENTDV